MPEALLTEQEIATPADPDAPTILAVGLSQEDRLALRRILAGRQWHLREAHGLHEALVIVSNQVVPVVLCECELPVGTWKDLLRPLQSLAPSPCLIVTSRIADTRLWAEVLNLGGDDLLTAPFSPNDVLRVLDLTLQRWRRTWQTSPVDTSQPHPSWLFEDSDLTAIERKIAVLAVQGLTDSEVAMSLHLKETQVQGHLLDICSKLKVPDRLALVIYAIDRAMRRRSTPRALVRLASAGVPMLISSVA